ncbi:cytochrome P450 [Mycena leptocephala]|nr:cytochrome P450 [Mycena leptocephala]
MHLEVLGRTMIILDSYRAAVDLLDKRGSIYSDRPKFTLYELLGGGFKPMQTQEARMLVRNLIESTTDKYDPFLSRFATGIITQIVAGHQILSNDDPYLRMSTCPLDFFPILQHFPPWFPGAHHVGIVRAWRSTLQDLYDYPLSTVKKQQEIGEALPSFILTQLEQGERGRRSERRRGHYVWSRGVYDMGYTAVFVLAMTLHPECQAKAQKEIDSVVGDLRLPDFEDRKHLPFVECILQETLRWNPGVPLGVPHCVMQDDVYRGMHATFRTFGGMSLDETRFLPKPAGNGEPYFNNVAFGFGRRICTGQHVAENSLWIAIASILASCKISNAVDENGNIIVPESGLTDGLVSHPKDTRCVISPRSSGARELVLETAM